MQYPAFPSHIAVLTAGLLLAACGGGNYDGGSVTPTAEGVLKDANVAGLNYSSGGQKGATGADGSFTYEVGRDVTFFLGGLIIGTVPGQAVVTPIDFAQNGSTSSAEVLNRVRLLMLLDEDANPDNGIQISVALRDHADVTPSIWQPVDFTVTTDDDLNAELNLIMVDLIINLQRQPRSLETEITAAVAQDHLESTLRCVRSGGFRGTLTSGDTGRLGVMVDAATGEVRGYITRSGSGTLIELDGDDPVSLDQEAFFTSTGTGATFMGRLLDPDTIVGTWQHVVSGTYQGTRLGGAGNAVYRFTATYEGAVDAGVYTFDINAAGNITGTAYSVPDDRLTTLSGTLSNSANLFVTTSEGRSVTAVLDLTAGTMTGGFDGDGNTLTGSGCRLN